MSVSETKTTKRTRPASPSKEGKTPSRKRFTYLKGYRELVPDPWGLES